MIEQIAAEENIRIVWEKEEITHWNLIGSPGYVKKDHDEYFVKCGKI